MKINKFAAAREKTFLVTRISANKSIFLGLVTLTISFSDELKMSINNLELRFRYR